MNLLTINIAYIADNQDAVNELVADLSPTGVNFNLIDAADFVNEEDFKGALTNNERPCFLIISDNFLKAIASLKNGLAYLQLLIKNEQVIPIIVDGVQVDEQGNKQLVATEFERVSNVIKYMNFWQEKYLELRRLKRNIPDEEEEAFLEKLKDVRSISSEVGEYLRTLRDTNYYAFSDFSANHYEHFFRNFGEESDYLKFVAARNENPVTPTTVNSVTTPMEVKASIQTAVENTTETPAFLPIDDLIFEKEKLEDLAEISASAKSDNELQTSLDELTISEETSFMDDDLPTAPIAESQLEDLEEIPQIFKEPIGLIEKDPEWQLGESENGADIEYGSVEEEEESTLSELAESEERPLTDTELLALELAQKMPATHKEETSFKEDEEEMISLEELLGEDLLSATQTSEEVFTNNEAFKEEIETVNTDVSNPEPTAEVPDNSAEVGEEDEDEDELEGYFVDEGDENEDLEEELSEIEVLQSAGILVQSGKINDAISLLEDTLSVAPDFVSVRYQYAAFLAKFQNNFKEASNQLAILLEEEPHNQSALFFLGELAEVERDYLTAKSYYERVYEENEDFPNVAYKLGMLLVNHLEEPPKNAIDYFELAYQQNPNNINALYQLGLLKSEDKTSEEQAINALKEVLVKAPEHPFANYDLAIIYHRNGAKSTALQYYESAAAVNPELKTAVNDQAFAIETEERILQAEQQELANNLQNQPTNQLESATLTDNLMDEEVMDLDEEQLAVATELPPSQKLEVSSKIALITGATSGIGKAIATKLAQEGFSLILTGRRFSRLFQLKERFEEDYNIAVRLLSFDIQKATTVQTALAELEEEWQNVDILINNAGLAKGETPIHEGDLAHWELMIDTNIKGLLYVTREIAPYMVQRKKGQIINICSLAGKEVYPNNGVYCATKHAVDALTKAMRIDLHQYNIRVSQVSPGFVEDTEFAAVKSDQTQAAITDFIPVNATDVAEVIHFMLTRPQHVTLQEIVLTGTQQASANIINRSGR